MRGVEYYDEYGAEDDPAKSSVWDPKVFDQRVSECEKSWNESSAEKNIARFQDLSIGIVSNHGKQPKKEKPWPFESSPCAMFGGKNTRPGEDADRINKELFNPNFVEEHHDFDIEDKSFASDGEGDVEIFESSDSDSNEGKHVGNQKSRTTMKTNELKIESESKSKKIMNVDRRKNLERHSSHRMTKSRTRCGENDEPVPANRSSANVSLSRNEIYDSSADRVESTRNRGKEDRPYNQMLSWNKNQDHEDNYHESEELELSEKIPSESRRGMPRRSIHRNDGELRRSSSRRDLNTSSSSSSRVRSTSNAPHGRASRNPIKRIKSTDDLDSSRRSKKDELGAATLHGKSSVSHIRTKRRSEAKKSSSSDRRATLTRAMSSTNVRRPEEYVPRRKEDSLTITSSHEGTKVKPRARKQRLSRQVSQRSVSSSGHPSTSDTELVEDSNHVDLKVSRKTRPRRPTTQEAPSPRTSAVDARRDLLILLREQKDVTQQDLMDKENRRLLHFLLYEHKMGFSLKEMHDIVRRDLEAGIPIPPRRQQLRMEL